MFLGILSTFFTSLETIFYKKALALGNQISGFGFMFFSWIIAPFVILFLILQEKIDFSSLRLHHFFIIGLICVFWFLSSLLGQYAYKREKVSVLTPYSNMNQVLALTFSFVLFHDVSVFTFVISLLVVLLVFLFSTDFKKLILPKVIKAFILSEALIATSMILLGYMMLEMSSFTYYILESTIGLIFLTFLLVIKKDFQKMKYLSRKFFIHRFFASGFGNIGYLINLFLIANFGVVVGVMLSFLNLIFLLIFGFFILGEKPDKKSIILGVLIIILVGIGFYYK